MDFDEQYLTYLEYQELGGTLNEAPFNILEFQARKEVDKYTFGRLKNLDEQVEEVKLCVFNLINNLEGYNKDLTKNKTIASESTDGYSITYKTLSSDDINAKNSEIKNIIEIYLSSCQLKDGTPYLYRGLK